MRATIVAAADTPAEVAAVEAWLARWAGRCAYVSADEGCGCCVSLWNVDAPEAALAELPAVLLVETDWSRGAASSAPPPAHDGPTR